MKSDEKNQVIETALGFWQMSDQRVHGLVRWLEMSNVDAASAVRALIALAGQYDQAPSVKQLGAKLAEIGADVDAPVGVGHPTVVARMKDTILNGPYGRGGAREVAARTGQTVMQRLRSERLQAVDMIEEAQRCDLGSLGYWRDVISAIDEAIREVEAA